MNTNTQRCPHCNQPVASDSLFCEWCGKPLHRQPAAPQQAAPPPVGGPPPIAPPQSPPPTAYPPAAAQPQPQAAPPPAAPQPKRKTSPILIIGLVVALLLCCLVAIIGGVILWQRSQTQPTLTPPMSGAVPERLETAPVAPPTQPTDPAPPTLPADPPPSPTVESPVTSGAAVLAGEWEIIEDPYGDVGLRFRLEPQPDGRLRLRIEDEYDDIEGIEDLEQYYLELAPDGEGRWRGDAVTTEWNPETGDYDEMGREPFVVILSQDGQQIIVGPPDSEGSVAQRVSGP